MKIDHPTNDPRPSFRQTRKHNSITNPPFTRKQNLSLRSSGICMGPRTTETKRQGRAGQTSSTKMNKANLGSQLSIFYTGSLARARPRPNEFAWAPARPKRSDKGEPGKRAARTSTKPTSGHNLAFFDTGSFARARPRPNDPPERVHTDALKRPTRTILHGRPNDRNEATRESRANELHERAQSQPRVTT
jgi:hypothetical protein